MSALTVPTAPAPTAKNTFPIASPIATGISTTFLQREALELARRILAQLDTPEELAMDMGLSSLQWQVLKVHPGFLKIMEEAQAEANSAAGLADRVRLKAMVVLDRGGLLDMAQIMNDAGASPTARVGAFNAVMEAAGIAKQKDQSASQAGSGPLVVIHMPTAGAPISIGNGQPPIEHTP